MIYASIIFLISLSVYLVALFNFKRGLIFKKTTSKNVNSPPVSVVVAVRNGEKNCTRLLNSLQNQNYSGQLEFLIVDDASSDNTSIIINDFLSIDSRFIYVHSSKGNSILSHKKKALDAGINMASYEHLLFTDIDCIIHSNWVSNMINSFKDEVDYVIGYSETEKNLTFSSIFQRIDFFMLMSAAHGMVNNGSPWACSGQNQGYRKSLYNRIGGFKKISNQLQGDDTLFMLLCRKYGKAKFSFASPQYNDKVFSRAENTWISLIKQRIRWAGDMKIVYKYNIPFYSVSISTFFLNLFLILVPLFSIKLFLSALFLKFIFESNLFLLSKNLHAFNYPFSHFIFWFILQIPFVVLVASLTIINLKPQWRGR